MQVDVATEFLGKTDSEAVVSEGHCIFLRLPNSHKPRTVSWVSGME